MEKKSENIQININKRKLLTGIGCFLVVLCIIALSFVVSKNYSDNNINESEVELIDITIDEYLSLMNSEDKKIVYVARPTCSYCQKQSPILKKIIGQYDLEVYYLDTSNFFDSEIADYTEDGYKFIASDEHYSQGYGTPNTIIVQGGKIVDGVFQYVEANELKDLFVRNGFINE